MRTAHLSFACLALLALTGCDENPSGNEDRADAGRTKASTRPALPTAGKLQAADMAYADEWIARLPKDRQTSAMYGLSESMAKTDVEGLAKKLTAMEKQDHVWVTGVRVLITNIESSDPEMAKNWKDAIISAGFK